MIGAPEILIAIVLLITIAGPAIAGVVIWKNLTKRPRDSDSPKGQR